LLNFSSYIDTLEYFVSFYFYKLLILIGIIMRIGWHISVPYFIYLWLDPQQLGDIPFSQFTLNMLFSNLFCILIAIGAFYNFFNFPETEFNEGIEPEKLNGQELKLTIVKSSPYVGWAKGSFGIIFLVVFFLAWMDG